MHFRTSSTLLSISLFAAALTAADLPKPGVDPERLARIAPRMKQFTDKGTLAGVVTLVARRGQIVHHEAVGITDVETRKPMQKDTIFQIMSMTKPVVGMGIMLLAEEGKLAVGDPVERYLPEYRGQMLAVENADKSRTLKKPSRPITIRDLLTHTSGMPTQPPTGIADLYARMDLTLNEAVKIFSQQPLDFEPGAKWQYSNMGIDTLGRIIEVVSDMPFERFLEERFFKPLGMKDSFLFPPADKIARIALVHRYENGKLIRDPKLFYGGDSANYRKGAKFSAPSYGLYSTASDLAAFYEMMRAGGVYNGKRILSPAAIAAATTVQSGTTRAGMGSGYGLSWDVVDDPKGTMALKSIGTYGHGGAFGTQGWVDKTKDMVGVFLIQSSGGPDGGFAASAFATMAAASLVD